MSWGIEFTDEFGSWWETLSEGEQDAVDRVVLMLGVRGPMLPFPYSSGITRSKHSQMRELRIQYCGEPYRVLYAFDPRRVAILILGGNKVGDDRWYETQVPKADKLFDEHLLTLEKEGLL